MHRFSVDFPWMVYWMSQLAKGRWGQGPQTPEPLYELLLTILSKSRRAQSKEEMSWSGASPLIPPPDTNVYQNMCLFCLPFWNIPPPLLCGGVRKLRALAWSWTFCYVASVIISSLMFCWLEEKKKSQNKSNPIKGRKHVKKHKWEIKSTLNLSLNPSNLSSAPVSAAAAC